MALGEQRELPGPLGQHRADAPGRSCQDEQGRQQGMQELLFAHALRSQA